MMLRSIYCFVFIAAFFLQTPKPIYAEVDLTTGLMAYYPFNGNANDESGNGNHGTVNGAILTTDRKGNGDSAYSFDGTDDYIDIGQLNLTSSNFTISAWVRGNNNSYNSIFTENDGEFDEGVGLFQQAGTKFTLILKDSRENNQGLETNSNFLVDTWYHLVAIRNNNELEVQIYVDGNLKSSKSITNWADITVENTAKIGVQSTTQNGFVNYMNGQLDDIRIYNRALSETEVQQLYFQESLIAYYPFNGNANDESGNGNHGTVNGATLTVDRHGNEDSAYSFDGVDDYIDIPDFFGIFDGIQDFSINLWAKRSGDGTNQPTLLDFRGENYLIIHEYASDSFKIGAEFKSTSSYDLKYSDKLSTISFQMISITYSANDGMKLFIDGALVDSNSSKGLFSGALGSHTNSVGSDGDHNQFFQGVIDDIRLYSKTLSSFEIQNIYDQEKPANLTDGLVAYYPFNGNANDESGNGNHGIVNDAKLTTDRHGNSNSAFSFDGIDDFVSTSVSLSQIGDIMTISVWFKTNEPVGQKTIVGSQDSIVTMDLRRPGDSGHSHNLGAYVKGNGISSNQPIGSQEFSFDVWNHGVLTIDASGNIALYINGILDFEDSRLWTGGLSSNAQNLFIGAKNQFGGCFSMVEWKN